MANGKLSKRLCFSIILAMILINPMVIAKSRVIHDNGTIQNVNDTIVEVRDGIENENDNTDNYNKFKEYFLYMILSILLVFMIVIGYGIYETKREQDVKW